MKQNFSIPEHVSHVTKTLENAGFQAFLVGGCVRDLVMGIEPKDWDITTNATPEQVIPLFEKTVHENDFGMVAVINEDEPDDSPFRQIEVTTFRSETTYSNNRHPDSIEYSKTLEEDLKRRDFTMNALAYNVGNGELTDMYDGLNDIEKKVIKTVGNPHDRFEEDALRMLRAVRFAAQLGFHVEPETRKGIEKYSQNLESISAERIREEFEKMVMSASPMHGFEMAHELELLQYVSREIEEGIGVDQNRNHKFTVWEHNLRALQNAADQKWPFHVRLAAMFHDVGKPKTKRFDKQQNEYTFYGHEVVGARMVKKFMERLKFPKKEIKTVEKLVRHHMFFSDPDKITLSAVRRMVKNVGPEHIWDLMNVRRADRIGMGRPKATPYRLRKYASTIEEALRDPISVGQLQTDGDYMIAEMNMKPGPRMGWMLHALLEEVLDDPTKNTLEQLVERVKDLDELSDADLRKLGEKGKEKKEAEDAAEVEALRKKHGVK
jgi:tRNA nucleotidyltransferase (CCA-adding enzyme)